MLDELDYIVEHVAPRPTHARDRPTGKTPRKKPTICSAADLQRKQFLPIRWIVPGYIAEGCTLLAGRPKIGKSWLMLDIALAVAAEGECLGNIACEGGEVLYLALEDNERRIKSRIDKLFGTFSNYWPERFEYATEWARANEGGIDDIRDWIVSKENPRLIIVDVLAMFKPVRGERESLYEADYNSIKGLQTLAGKHHVAIVIVHHTRKSGSDTDPFEKVSGTLALSGAADTTIILDRESMGATLYGRGRDVEEFEKAVTFNRAQCRWIYLGKASDVRRSDERSTVINLLRESEEPLSPKEILPGTKMTSLDALYVLLLRMARAGEILKVRRGRYTVPGKEVPPCKDGKDVRSEDQPDE